LFFRRRRPVKADGGWGGGESSTWATVKEGGRLLTTRASAIDAGKTLLPVMKNVFSLASASSLVAGGVFILNILVARRFGPAEFGQYSFAFAFAATFTVVSHLGLDLLITRDVARDKSQAAKALGTGLVLALAGGLLTLLLISGVLSLLRYSLSTKLMIFIAGAALLPGSLTLLCRAIFRAFERMELELLVSFISTALFLLSALTVVVLGGSVVMVVAAYPLAGLVAFAVAFALVRAHFAKPRFVWDPRFFRYLVITAIPFALNGLLLPIYLRIDTIMVATLKGEAATGVYSAAYTIIAPLGILGPSVARAIFPRLAYTFVSSQRSYQTLLLTSAGASLALLIPFAIGAGLLAKPILTLVFGSGYAEAAVALQILAWAGVLMFVNVLFFSALEASNRQVKVTLFLAGGTVTSFVLSLLLVQLFGYNGAALAVLVTQGVVLLLNLGALSGAPAVGEYAPAGVR
ncbi:MAG: flippase, partial [Anaerolineae bacterium]